MQNNPFYIKLTPHRRFVFLPSFSEAPAFAAIYQIVLMNYRKLILDVRC